MAVITVAITTAIQGGTIRAIMTITLHPSDHITIITTMCLATIIFTHQDTGISDFDLYRHDKSRASKRSPAFSWCFQKSFPSIKTKLTIFTKAMSPKHQPLRFVYWRV